MKLQNFVKMSNSFSLTKEQNQGTKCFGKAGHDKTFEEAMEMLFDYAAAKNIGTESIDIKDMDRLNCSEELVELIKKAQEKLGFKKPDGIVGRKTISAMEKYFESADIGRGLATALWNNDQGVLNKVDKLGVDKITKSDLQPSSAGDSAVTVKVNQIDQKEANEEDIIIIGDSNSVKLNQFLHGQGNASTLEDTNYTSRSDKLKFFQKNGNLLAPSIASGWPADVLETVKDFFQVKGENYKPKIAIIHMGYNGPGPGSARAYKETVEFLKKRVLDVRAVKLKVREEDYEGGKNNKYVKKIAYMNQQLEQIPGITIIDNPGENGTGRWGRFHFTPQGYADIYDAALSGTPARQTKPTTGSKAIIAKSGKKTPEPEAAGGGFAGFISKGSRASTVKMLSSFGTFREIMDSVTNIFKAAAEKVNVEISENPTIGDLKKVQEALGISSDGTFGPTSMAAISLINSKYSNIIQEAVSSAINLNPYLPKSFKSLVEQSLTGLVKEEKSNFGVIDVDVYVEEHASRASLQKAYSGAVKKGLKVSKPPMNNKFQKKDESWRQDKEFLGKIKKYSDENGVDPKVFLALIAHETGGTFSSFMENHIGCVGLIQFCPDTGMKTIGKNSEQLKGMSRSEQWDEVEKFYDKRKNVWKDKGSDFATIYLITFLPTLAGLPDNAVVAASPDHQHKLHRFVKKHYSKSNMGWWKANPANRDPENDNIITKSGLGRTIAKNINKFNITDKLFEG